jgi:hypothetical protein
MPHVSELHAQHDLLLVASLAAGDPAGADRDHASAQIDACADCAGLHADLIVIARATAALPPVVAPRDFTLSPEQAAALRPVGWRRLIAAIGGSRPLMSRQLGIGLATIGLAGLLVSTLPGIQLGSNASGAPAFVAAPAGNGAAVTGTARDSAGVVTAAGEGASPPAAMLGTLDQAASPSATKAPPLPADEGSASGGAIRAAPGASQGSPETTEGRIAYGAHAAGTTAPELPGSADQLISSPAPSDGGHGLLVAGSALLLAVGIALLLIRRLVRRFVPS